MERMAMGPNIGHCNYAERKHYRALHNRASIGTSRLSDLRFSTDKYRNTHRDRERDIEIVN